MGGGVAAAESSLGVPESCASSKCSSAALSLSLWAPSSRSYEGVIAGLHFGRVAVVGGNVLQLLVFVQILSVIARVVIQGGALRDPARHIGRTLAR